MTNAKNEDVWVPEEILGWLREHARWVVTLEGNEYISRQWAYFADEKAPPEFDTHTLRGTSLAALREGIVERYGYLGDLVSEPAQDGEGAEVLEIWRVVNTASRH